MGREQHFPALGESIDQSSKGHAKHNRRELCASLQVLAAASKTLMPGIRGALVVLQEAQFRGREDTLKRRDIELQDSLIRFSKFLQDNDAKRVRALKKAADERKIREEKEREMVETVVPSDPSLGGASCCE